MAQAYERRRLGRAGDLRHADRGGLDAAKPVAILLAGPRVLQDPQPPVHLDRQSPLGGALQGTPRSARPGFPALDSIAQGQRDYCRELLPLVQRRAPPLRHRPDDTRAVHHGRRSRHTARARVLEAAYTATPEPVRPPATASRRADRAWINKPHTRRSLTKFAHEAVSSSLTGYARQAARCAARPAWTSTTGPTPTTGHRTRSSNLGQRPAIPTQIRGLNRQRSGERAIDRLPGPLVQPRPRPHPVRASRLQPAEIYHSIIRRKVPDPTSSSTPPRSRERSPTSSTATTRSPRRSSQTRPTPSPHCSTASTSATNPPSTSATDAPRHPASPPRPTAITTDSADRTTRLASDVRARHGLRGVGVPVRDGAGSNAGGPTPRPASRRRTSPPSGASRSSRERQPKLAGSRRSSAAIAGGTWPRPVVRDARPELSCNYYC